MVRRGAICSLQPRKKLLERPTIANVDQILLVVAAAQPELNTYLLDRFLVLAAHADLPPVIVVNKRDLVPAEQLAEVLEGYRGLGYAVVATEVVLTAPADDASARGAESPAASAVA